MNGGVEIRARGMLQRSVAVLQHALKIMKNVIAESRESKRRGRSGNVIFWIPCRFHGKRIV